MLGIGIVEAFYGPEWSWDARHRLCRSLGGYGGNFYIYAPKRDSFLRKNWTKHHPKETWQQLKELGSTCRQAGLAFGVGLSPFEIYSQWNRQTQDLLQQKIESLVALDIKYLGLFFDDMHSSPDLAERQLEILSFVRTITDKTLLFCPTYYSFDPILDKVFGPRPPRYLELIGQLSSDIQIFWTGSKVISPAITSTDLNEIAVTLKRKPVVWDNFFANDGPKQCKFLKVRPLTGRTRESFLGSAGWAFNLMNQPNLSEIVFAACAEAMRNGGDSAILLKDLARIIAGPVFGDLIDSPIISGQRSLDDLTAEQRQEILEKLDSGRFAQDIANWLKGRFNVGSECLTD